MAVNKAVIATAGFGTRRLPVAKAVEKCMIPILNRPTIDYVVSECIAAGVHAIAFVVSDSHQQLKSYYSRDLDLEQYLHEREKPELLDSIGVPDIEFEYIIQDRNGKYGTSVPLWLAKEFIGPDKSFLYLGGDSFTYQKDGSDLGDMINEAQRREVGAAILTYPVDQTVISQYGAIVRDGENYSKIIEHPEPAALEEYLVNTAEYMLGADIWPFVEDNINGSANHKGEYFAIDIINDYVAAGHNVYVHQAKGPFLDNGNLPAWLKANNYLAGLH